MHYTTNCATQFAVGHQQTLPIFLAFRTTLSHRLLCFDDPKPLITPFFSLVWCTLATNKCNRNNDDLIGVSYPGDD